jgi:hypothetical protein
MADDRRKAEHPGTGMEACQSCTPVAEGTMRGMAGDPAETSEAEVVASPTSSLPIAHIPPLSQHAPPASTLVRGQHCSARHATAADHRAF